MHVLLLSDLCLLCMCKIACVLTKRCVVRHVRIDSAAGARGHTLGQDGEGGGGRSGARGRAIDSRDCAVGVRWAAAHRRGRAQGEARSSPVFPC